MSAEADTLDVPPSAADTHEPSAPTQPTSPDAPTLTSVRVRFNCPNCHKELTVPANEPLGECPQCGASLTGAATGATGRTASFTHRSRAGEEARTKALEWMRGHFEGKYEILDFVKSGGMGAVYRARQQRPSRIVALKVLLGGHFASTVQLRRFEREAQAVAMLKHPAIVPVYEYGEADGQPYFTMEFVEGMDLRSYALENRLSREEICRQMVRVCDAIQYAHEHGVVHRDLKPGNIMVDGLNRPRILDFGLSRAPISEDDEEERLTATGEYLGTPRYMSPEQAMGKPSGVDERTDVFALGVMLYEMIVGTVPYPIEHVRGMKLVEVLTTWEPLRPSALKPDVPRDLEIILLKAVAREKDQRYQSARALGEDLESWLAGRPIAARPATLEYLLSRWAWRNRKVLIPAALAVLVVLAFSGYGMVRLGQEVAARRAKDAIIARLAPFEQAYIKSFANGRQAVDKAVQEGQWKNYSLSLSYGLKPFACVQIEIDGNLYQETSSGDGQYDAFMKALRIIYDKLDKQYPVLIDYQVSIPPGGKTDAFVETVITWDYNGKEFKTRGFDADQTESAIKATERMLNIIENLELKVLSEKKLTEVKI